MILKTYRLASHLLAPLAPWWLARRIKGGKEDPQRSGEKMGIPSCPRPPGPLVWIHAASVGESMATLALIERLSALRPGVGVLVTSGTMTAARLLGARLPPRTLHQYAPLDIPHAVARFLDHWRPHIALWTESEIWPNLILESHRRKITLLLINGRLSDHSRRRWQRAPKTIAHLLSCFTLCLAQNDHQARTFRSLGAPRVDKMDNLKWAVPPLPHAPQDLTRLKALVAGRPLWLASSTHPGEEDIVIQAHQRLKTKFPRLLTLIAPRHPTRGDAIAHRLSQSGLSVAQRTKNTSPTPDHDVYLADTVGELGLLYRVSDIVFLGGSLVKNGGHNPIEPAHLACAILTGPHTDNFTDIMAEFITAGGLTRVHNAHTLAQGVERLMNNSKTRQQAIAANQSVIDRHPRVADQVISRIAPYLPSGSSGTGHGSF